MGGWVGMSLEIGLVIIVYTPVLSTTWSYWFLLHEVVDNDNGVAYSDPILFCADG